jgi:hypothetical protein
MSRNSVCSNTKCAYPDTGHCYANADPVSSCIYLNANTTEKKKEKKSISGKSYNSFWSGEFFNPSDILQVSQRSTPYIIGVVGAAKAGKTSYLGMLYTLMLNGRFLADFSFAGSYTLTAWERIAYALKFHNGHVTFPEATPANPDFYSIYHFSLKDGASSLKDVLIADASGEVFSDWAINRNNENTATARWINDNSDAFIFFIDCEALIEKRAEAKESILDIAQQLKQDLGDRPVALVWSKADRIAEVRENLKQSLEEELTQIFPLNSKKFEISNFSLTDPDAKCHENNLDVFNWMLSTLQNKSGSLIKLDLQYVPGDALFNYTAKRND